MSILLDALKKSEQQRQLGQPPTLTAQMSAQPPEHAGAGRWIPAVLVVLSALVMAWFGWQQLREPTTSTQISEPVVAGRSAQDSPVESLVPAEEADTPRTLTEAYSGSSAATEEAPTAVEEDRRRLSRSVSEFTAQSDSPDSRAEQQEQEQGPVDVKPLPGRPAARPDDPSSRTVAPPREPRRSGVEPHVAEPISYWELPQGIRDNLPDIKITVLVFSERPKDRFLLANGQRMTEKDELTSGLVLDEIRRDGAVFLYRNYRFLVKG